MAAGRAPLRLSLGSPLRELMTTNSSDFITMGRVSPTLKLSKLEGLNLVDTHGLPQLPRWDRPNAVSIHYCLIRIQSLVKFYYVKLNIMIINNMVNRRQYLTKTVISNDEVNNFLKKPKQPLYNDKYHYLYI